MEQEIAGLLARHPLPWKFEPMDRVADADNVTVLTVGYFGSNARIVVAIVNAYGEDKRTLSLMSKGGKEDQYAREHI